MQRPPLPPFTREGALAKVQAAEDAWNSREPERVALAYSPDSQWRNRDEFFLELFRMCHCYQLKLDL